MTNPPGARHRSGPAPELAPGRSVQQAPRARTIQLVGFVLAAVAVVAVAVVFFVRARHHDVRSATGSPASGDAAAGAATLDQPDRATAYLAAAASDIAAVTTYDYHRMDDALSAGLSVSTGAYQRSYRQAFSGPLRATARKNHVVQTFEQLKIGIGAIDANGKRASVLVFGTERMTGSTGTSADDVTLTATIVHTGNGYLISKLDEGVNAGLPPGSEGLRAAAEAARSEVVNLGSYRRSAFDADYQRALAGAADPLRKQIELGAAGTKAGLLKGNYDLSGAVTAVAVESASTTSVVLLVAATELRVAPDGTRTNVTGARFEVTTVFRSGKWVTVQAAPVKGSG